MSAADGGVGFLPARFRQQAAAGDRSQRARVAIVLLALLLAGVALYGLASGASDVSAMTVVAAWRSGKGKAALSARDRIIVYAIRLPRIVMGIMVGAALAVAGATMQGLFRNPLADPGIVGVSAGAGL